MMTTTGPSTLLKLPLPPLIWRALTNLLPLSLRLQRDLLQLDLLQSSLFRSQLVHRLRRRAPLFQRL